jgi:glycosyltransferase involved in cell wall biosynthesis
MEQKDKPKIGIFTTFYNLNTEYSLCTVVLQQLQALKKNGFEPVLYVLTNFSGDVPEGIEVRKVIPQLILEPYGRGDFTNYEEDIDKALKAMEEHMADIDVCLTHDIIFINSYLPYNEALRRSIKGKLSHIKWLHWMHSGPSIRPTMDGSPYDNLYTLPDNSRLIYMNYTDALRAAEMYGVYPKEVRTIFNPMDIRTLYDFHPLSWELTDQYDLMNADVVDIYPLSSTRMNDNGKQLSKVIWVMSHIKKMGKTIRIVVCNAHANAKKEKDEIERMYQYAAEKGIERRELIFTSMHNIPKWEHGVPHKVISDLFLLSNIFIFPSVSENCPLVLLEAMAAKNLLVLNANFPAFRDFGLENAMYFNFGSLVQTPNFPCGEDRYMGDVAKLIIAELSVNKALNANAVLRKKFNLDYIFEQQLSTAIMEMYYGN